MKTLLVLLLPLALAACESKDDAEAEAEPQDAATALAAGNTMHCTVDGRAFDAKGEQVDVGSLGIVGDAISFTIGLHVERDGHTHFIDSSLTAFPLRPGTYHFPPLDKPGYSYAEYRIKDAQYETIASYNGSIYGMHFSPVENDPEAKLKLDIEKLDLATASMPGFKRLDLAGRFTFNAAALPDGQTSEACSKEAIERSMQGLGGQRPLPMFNAKVCGTKKVHVQCSFKVAGEFVVQ